LIIDHWKELGTWYLLHVGKVVEVAGGWQTPSAIATITNTCHWSSTNSKEKLG
jgi:hypothetical protein